MESSPITIAIVEDDHRIRAGLAMLIDATPGFRCPCTFDSMETLYGVGYRYREI